MNPPAMRLGRGLRMAALALLVMLFAFAVGGASQRSPALGVAIALGVLLLGVSAVQPAALPIVAVPLIVVSTRIGTEGLDLSVSDAALGLASVTALIFTFRPFSPPLRTLLWLNAGYQLVTLLTVTATPQLANTVEWFHAWMLVSGALIVGWTIGRAGYAKFAVRLLVAILGMLAVSALVQALTQYGHGDFSAVYLRWPIAMHKNALGTLLTFGATIAYARPAWLDYRRWQSTGLFLLLTAGMLVTQSRQAIISMAVALLVLALRRGGGARRRRPEVIVFVVVPILVLVATMVRDQVRSGNRFNSVFQRVTWFQDAISFWSTSPWLGHGLRFWYYNPTLPIQPPNAELEVLTSSGVVGLVAFLIMMVGVLVVLWRLDPAFGTLAFVLVLARLVQGQLDLFWAAVQVPLPFLIAGICLALQDQADSRDAGRLRQPDGAPTAATGGPSA